MTSQSTEYYHQMDAPSQTPATAYQQRALQHQISVSTLNTASPQLPSPKDAVSSAATTNTSPQDRRADALATLKLRRQTVLNARLRKELTFKRIPASEACSSLIAFTQNVQGDPALHDYCVPSVYGTKPAYMGPDGLPAAPPAALMAGYDGLGFEAGYDAMGGAPGKGTVYYEEEKKTLLSPVSGKFSTGGGGAAADEGRDGGGGGGCCTIM